MKKLVLSALVLSAVLTAAGCGKKNDEVIAPSPAPVQETEPEQQQEEQQYEEDTKPTERVANIQTADDYEYEILDGGVTITKYIGTDTVIEVPAQIEGVDVTFIDDHAFEFKYKVTSITLPDTVTGIGESAFSDCSALESINVPDGVTHIDRGAFIACTSLTSITLPAAVESVKEEAFTACESLTTVTVLSTTLKYERWGLDEVPSVSIYAPEGSPVATWAENNGKYAGSAGNTEGE